MAQTGDIRFQVEFMPISMAEKIRAEDETDWPGDHMQTETVADFSIAAKLALLRAQGDYFGASVIREMHCTDGKHDWWDQEAYWEVTPEMHVDDIDPKRPDT